MGKNKRDSQRYEQQAHAARHARQTGERMLDRHFHELLDLAAEGNAEAVQDLWLQYEYDFASRAGAMSDPSDPLLAVTGAVAV